MSRVCLSVALWALMVAGASVATAAESYRAYVDGPWGQIHIRVAGDRAGADHTVFLLHKMVWSSAQFKHAQPLLAARGIRSVAIDLPGYGHSDGPKAVPTTQDYANALLPVLDHFRLQRAYLLGNDTGATIFAALAEQHPHRVLGLILHGPAIFDAEMRQQLLAQPHYDQTPRADGSHVQGRWDTMYKLAGSRSSIESIHDSVLLFFQAGTKEWFGHEAIFSYDLGATLQRLTVPVCLITNRGDVLYTQALQAKNMRPDFQLHQLAFNGVHAIYDDPVPWADAVAGCLLAP